MIKRLLPLLLLCSLLLSLLPMVASGLGVSITSDADFFSKLNLNTKGLEQVKTAVGKSDYTTAKQALLQFYKDKFSTLEAKPNGGASDHAVFMAMNDVWAFSENYISGVEITSSGYEAYTLNLGSNLHGIYVLDQIYATTDGVAICTSESENPPQLEIYSSNGTLLTTLPAIEDTSVRPGKDLSMNYGGMQRMYAKHWPNVGGNKPYSTSSMRAYVRFDSNQIPSNAHSAKLKLYARRSPGNADGVLVEDSLYLCAFQCYSTNWSEDSLTWDSLISGKGIGHYSYHGLPGGFDWVNPMELLRNG